MLSNWPKWLVVTQSVLFGSQDLEIRSYVSSFSAYLLSTILEREMEYFTRHISCKESYNWTWRLMKLVFLKQFKHLYWVNFACMGEVKLNILTSFSILISFFSITDFSHRISANCLSSYSWKEKGYSKKRTFYDKLKWIHIGITFHYLSYSQ